MIWSVDQDDNDFSALSGLLGKDIPYAGGLSAEPVTEKGNWASHSYEMCKLTDCLKDGQVGIWGPRWKIAPGGGAFKDDCGKDKNKYVSGTDCCAPVPRPTPA